MRLPLKQGKQFCSNETSQKRKNSEKKVYGKSHSAENPKSVLCARETFCF